MSHVMLIPLVLSSLLLALWIQRSAAVVVSNSSQPCSVSCVVASNIRDYGFDANKEQVLIDLKRCVKVYINPSGTSCLSSAVEGTCQKQCTPRSYQLETHSNRTGPFLVRTIRRCHANSHHCQNCQWKAHRLYVFQGSRYQRRIDIGKCSGVCSEEGSASDLTTPTPLSCRPTRTRSLSVEGPNGHVTVEVVENCSCVSEQCYHVDHFQSVSARRGNRRQEELVNVGKCTGSCQGVFINGRCLQYSLVGHCIWYLPTTQGKCRPTRGSTFSFTDTSGANKTIPVVEECGCTTG